MENFSKSNPIISVYGKSFTELKGFIEKKKASSRKYRYGFQNRRDRFFRSLYKDIATWLDRVNIVETERSDATHLPSRRTPLFKQGLDNTSMRKLNQNRMLNTSIEINLDWSINSQYNIPYYKGSYRSRKLSMYRTNNNTMDALFQKVKPIELKQKRGTHIHNFLSKDHPKFKNKNPKFKRDDSYQRRLRLFFIEKYRAVEGEYGNEYQCCNPILYYIHNKYPDLHPTRLESMPIICHKRAYDTFRYRRLFAGMVRLHPYQMPTHPRYVVDKLALTHYCSPETLMILTHGGFPMMEETKSPARHREVKQDLDYKYVNKQITETVPVTGTKLAQYPMRIDMEEAIDQIIADYLEAIATLEQTDHSHNIHPTTKKDLDYRAKQYKIPGTLDRLTQEQKEETGLYVKAPVGLIHGYREPTRDPTPVNKSLIKNEVATDLHNEVYQILITVMHNARSTKHRPTTTSWRHREEI